MIIDFGGVDSTSKLTDELVGEKVLVASKINPSLELSGVVIEILLSDPHNLTEGYVIELSNSENHYDVRITTLHWVVETVVPVS